MFANWEYWAHFIKAIPAQYLLLYLLGVNLMTAAMYKYDKQAAIHKRWRVPESTLHLLMFAGGTFGALYGQKKLRHKNRKKQFLAVFWGLLAIQFIAVAYIIYV